MTGTILLLIADSFSANWVEELSTNVEAKTGCPVIIEVTAGDYKSGYEFPTRWNSGRYATTQGDFPPARKKNELLIDKSTTSLIIDLTGRRKSSDRDDDIPVLTCSLFDESYGALHADLLEAMAGTRSTVDVFIRAHLGKESHLLIKQGRFKTIFHNYRKTLDIILENLIELIPASAHTYYLTTKGKKPVKKRGASDLQKLIIGCKRTEKQHRLSQRMKLLFRSETWNTGFVQAPIEQVALNKGGNWQVQWDAELPTGSFRADPFGINIGLLKAIVFEKFSRKTGNLVLETAGQPAVDLLEHDIHRSYPYIFRYREEWYCLPEQKALKKLSLYRLDLDTSRLIHAADILDEVEAADPSIFFMNEKWWLFFTDTSRKGADLRLCIYHAEGPEGPWTPHLQNPVKTDITSARPAGHIFMNEGKAYRPAQDSSETYGGSIRIMRIDHLTPDTYAETEVNHLHPGQLGTSYPSGWHTLSIFGNGCLVDGKRSFIDPFKIFRAWRK